VRGKYTQLLRLRSEREGIPCDEPTGAVDAIGAVTVLVLLSARSMQGKGEEWRAMLVLLRASWGCCGCGERVERTHLRLRRRCDVMAVPRADAADAG
jgi:hypothetical protein